MESPVNVARGTGSGPRTQGPTIHSRTITQSVTTKTVTAAIGKTRTKATPVPIPASFFLRATFTVDNVAKGRTQ